MRFLMIDGAGDPNTAPAYARAVVALYAHAYAIKFHCKQALSLPIRRALSHNRKARTGQRGQ